MRLLLRVGIFSLGSNNFLDLGGLLCLLVFASPKALVHPNTLSSPTSLSLSSVLSLYILVLGKVDGTVGIPFKRK